MCPVLYYCAVDHVYAASAFEFDEPIRRRFKLSTLYTQVLFLGSISHGHETNRHLTLFTTSLHGRGYGKQRRQEFIYVRDSLPY
jgi:hypothetical protein